VEDKVTRPYVGARAAQLNRCTVSRVANIFEALRRIGTPSQKSAIRRLDGALQRKQVLDYKRVRIRTSTGNDETLVGITLPVPESIEILTDEEVRPL
jgi:hypothetical protein